MKTLVLTDFSDVSKRALEYTLDLLVTQNSEDVTLAHVVSDAGRRRKPWRTLIPSWRAFPIRTA